VSTNKRPYRQPVRYQAQKSPARGRARIGRKWPG
jgi:hypothetical protein